jgi:FkbM family methyltransferase
VSLRDAAKALVERVVGRDIKKIAPGSVTFTDKRRRHEAWFCYDFLVQSLIEANHVDLVVDVGANEGQFAQRLRHAYKGDIISFEPVSKSFARLERAAAPDPRWSVHKMALGSANTTATIHVASSTKFSSLLTANEFSRQRFRRSTVDAEELVSVKRLEDVLPSLVDETVPKRLFLKLDTQGYDLEVFKGLGTLADQVVAMQSEVSLIPIYEGTPHWTHSIATYEHAGFHVAGLFPVVRDAAGRIIEYDCLMVRGQG